MSRNWTFARGRASLLATSMFATTALIGLGGAVVLAPGAALAAVCAPAPDANTAGGLQVTVNPLETCLPTTDIAGLGYTAGNVSGAGLVVTYKAPGPGGPTGNITTHGVGINATAGQDISFLVDTTTTAGPNITNTSGAYFGAGISILTLGGNITISTGNTTAAGTNTGGPFPSASPQAGAIVTGAIDGIDVQTSGAGSVTINAAGNVTGQTGDGIRVNAQNGNVSIIASCNGTSQIQSNSLLHTAGIAVTTTGGSVSIITDQGDSVGSLHGDGIDVTSTSGNIFVHLLDGAINANTKAALGASGVSSPFFSASAPLPGINLITGAAGTITLITDDNVNNFGPGDGIDTLTANSANFVQADANAPNPLGSGVVARATGLGNVTVVLGNATTAAGAFKSIYNVSTTGNAGMTVGVAALQTSGAGNHTATVLST